MNEPSGASQSSPPRAGRREWIGLAVIALPCLLYSMDLTVLHLAVPALSRELAPTSSELLWIIDIYGFLVAGSLITMGTLGDRIGRRRLLMMGAAAFGAASVLAACATSAALLIAARALLGLAGATIAPSTLSLIRNMFPDPEQRTTAIGIWVMSFSLGGAIGPLIGGVLLEHFAWGSVFLLSVPVMVLLLVVGPLLLPEYRDPNAGKPDLASAALSLAAVLLAIFGLKLSAERGLGVVPLLCVAAGLAIGTIFVRRQLVLADPLIDLRLFRLPGFSAALATYGLSIFVLFGGFLFLPQYLQLVLGLSPFESGLWTLPWALSFVLGSLVTPPLSRRVQPAYLMTGGLLLAAGGFAAFTSLDGTTGFWRFASGSFVFSLGLAPVFTLTTDIVVGSAPPERAGAASALSETSAELGGALGIAAFGSVGVAAYRHAMQVVPLALPREAAAGVRATLAGALETASELPSEPGAALVTAARDAFVRGLELCAGISSAGALGLAALVFVALRKQAKSAPSAEPERIERPASG